MMSKAYHHNNPRYRIPEGCKGYNCRRCVFKHLRPCLLPTYVRMETTVVYEEYPKTIYKISSKHSTNFNRVDII